MILQKITTTLTLSAILFFSTFGFLFVQPTPVAAMTDASGAQVCPITGSLSARFEGNSAEVRTVEDRLSERVVLRNISAYTLGGIRLGVGVYEAAVGATPDYWTVLPDVLTIGADDELKHQLNLDLSALPAGQYQVRVFAIQGDETAVLGAALLDDGQASSIEVVKSTPQASFVTVSLEVGGQVSQGQTLVMPDRSHLTVKAVTANKNDKPLLNNSRMDTVITQGKVPLGTAVRQSKLDSVKLVPGTARITELVDRNVEWGEYTVYAALISDNIMQPLVFAPVRIGDGKVGGKDFWPYVSKVGLSDYPLKADSEVVACIDYVGKDKTPLRFLEFMGVDFTFSDNKGEGEDATSRLVSTEVDTNNYFVYAPGKEAEDFTVKVDLLSEIIRPQLTEEQTSSGVRPNTLEAVNLTAQTFSCSSFGERGCVFREPTNTSIDTSLPNEGNPHPFWFYAGIIIAAALLLYIMLRRLPPESQDTGKKYNSEELQ